MAIHSSTLAWKNPMDGGAWEAAVHGVTKSQTRLSDFTFTFHFHALEKEMATHSTVLAWRIPGTGEPDRLPSTGSQSQNTTEAQQQQQPHSTLFHSQEANFPESSTCPKNQRWASKSAAALWTFPVTTTDHPCLLAPLIHKRWAAALDGCPQEMSCGGYCKIKTQTQNNF